MNTEGSLQVGTVNGIVWIRVNGRGTFQNSPLLKDCFERVFQGGRREIVVDLELCPSMDSTFMGILASAAIRLADSGSLHVLNANLRNRQLLTSLGLHYLLKIDTEGSAFPQERIKAAQALKTTRAATPVDKDKQAQIVLEAHESLMEANEGNVSRFEDVVEYLKRELDKDN